ncbi:Gfo/Idh/MocA family oxidoreductase [Bacillus sp. FJAT-49705]|uniref:Gfo/Idh/MocA family oxidoreductase n=1 Tax=Cytobacillus citreus TaxID=2833586 RepID=A0ABS5NZC5_9BACI|nr:Gfo/Idh/MocA family oxidoreductase [Cytobacillus citreus]MBS4193201.1 Gfo/Idh/MocA family oxidoreductase [Cytobacillus citreus]
MKNIGLVGLGFIGKMHLKAYHSIENCYVAAICTRSEVKDEEIIGLFNGTFVSDYDDLLRSEEIDIIDICLPTFLHEEYIIKAARAGKHIICEKPLTLSLESAERILKEVQDNGVRLFAGHLLRFWPEYKMIKSYSESDQLKDIEIVHGKRLGQAPAWSDWFQHPEKSGGALFDLHIHDIDFVFYLMGEAESVYAVGTKNKYGAWDHIMTTLSFKNNSIALVEASHRMPNGYPFTMSFRAQAVQGTLEYHVAAGENIEHINYHQFVYYNHVTKSTIDIVSGDAFQNELSYFVHCIETNQENGVIPLEAVFYTLKLLKAIEASLETGQKIRI